MTTGIDSNNTSVGGPGSAGGVDASDGPDAAARDSLRAEADSALDAVADVVADKVVGDPDRLETPTTADAAPVTGADATPAVSAVPSTEPTVENRAAANAFRDELHAIDERERDVKIQAEAAKNGDYRSPNDMRSEVLDRVAEHAQGIQDPAERDRFVRAVAPDVGPAAGKLSTQGPMAAYNKLDAIGQGVSADTGRLLAGSALQFGSARDNLVPMGRSGSPVGDAFTEVRQGQTERMGELLAGTARTVIPGVDAATHLVNGDLDAAAASAAVDLAGGAILRGGKVVVGAAAGALAMAPEDAQAGVLSRMTMRFGDEAVEITARKGLANGRTPTFDVTVPGAFKDGTKGTLQLADPRAKHNMLNGLPDGDLSRIARNVSRGKAPEFAAARNAAQFSDRYNSIEGQAQLARMVMDRITPEQLARVGRQGGELTIPLDRVIGLTPTRGGQVVPASSVRVMSNNDGAFHLVPMP